jgi:hypothetical protein
MPAASLMLTAAQGDHRHRHRQLWAAISQTRHEGASVCNEDREIFGPQGRWRCSGGFVVLDGAILGRLPQVYPRDLCAKQR